jgi:hypothetical protein
MGKDYTSSIYSLMRELVILSINISYVKDTIQQNERYKAKLMYLNISHGPLDVLLQDLVRRKVSLQKRFKNLIELQLVERHNKISNLLIVIPEELSGYRKKELEQGWAVLQDIYGEEWILNIRTGDLLESNYINTKFFVDNISVLGSVYVYFKISPQDPLPDKNIRY